MRALAFYRQLDDATFFPPPLLPRMLAEETHRVSGAGRVVDVKWASGYRPAYPEVAERWLKVESNRFAYARLYLHDEPGPPLVCLHGYRGGGPRVDAWAFDASRFFARGFDVALVQLPHHGRRRSDAGPGWPSRSLGWVNEGFGQAVWDARSLAAWLARRSGSSRIFPSVMGMSLGGYVAALWATVEPLAFVAPIIPLGAFAELIWNQRVSTNDEREAAARHGITLAELEAATRIHAPLQRTPKVPPARAHVIGADGDAIVPIVHAERLAAHFGCALTRLPGGHLLQVGRGRAYDALADEMLQGAKAGAERL